MVSELIYCEGDRSSELALISAKLIIQNAVIQLCNATEDYYHKSRGKPKGWNIAKFYGMNDAFKQFVQSTLGCATYKDLLKLCAAAYVERNTAMHPDNEIDLQALVDDATDLFAEYPQLVQEMALEYCVLQYSDFIITKVLFTVNATVSTVNATVSTMEGQGSNT